MGKRILVADDEPFMRETLRAILTRAGYDLVFAEDGESAVKMAWKESPDLILIDGLMPKMHGFLACKKIKEFKTPPKVIILTAIYKKPSYRREVQNTYSADDLLVKPFTAAELLACIQKHLPTAEVAALDISRLAGLFRLDTADDINKLSELINTFLKDTAKSLSNLKQALARRDAELLLRISHNLKGSSATIGAVQLAALSAELEEKTSAGSFDNAHEVLSGIEKEFERVCDYLKSKHLEITFS